MNRFFGNSSKQDHLFPKRFNLRPVGIELAFKVKNNRVVQLIERIDPFESASLCDPVDAEHSDLWKTEGDPANLVHRDIIDLAAGLGSPSGNHSPQVVLVHCFGPDFNWGLNAG